MWCHTITKILIWIAGTIWLALPINLWAAEPVAASVRAEQEVLNSTTLRAIFTLRKRRWSDGRPIQVFVLNDDDPAHKLFVREQLRMYPYQLQQYWNRVIYSGTGVAPLRFDDQQSLLTALAATPDAIGYAEIENMPQGIGVFEVRP